ncbi:hypothetical protein ACFYOV_16355 [Streptomyces sp. NPDC005931]|uniref:hypothetical protein n=1 Tax=Streptomyces sp. NPDC005931 TaxID=3364737 RepID=UPI00368A417C
MSPSQLAPGAEVVAVPGRGLALRTADGEFLTVRTGDADEQTLLARLSGTPAPADPEVDRLLTAFDTAGHLTDGPSGTEWPAGLRDVRLLGDPVLTDPLAALLRAAGAEPRPGTPEDPARGRPAAVVWCLDGPVPEGLWDAADRLPGQGIAWLRCHREGYQVYVEPPATAPGDVTAAHVRARRLAATPAHRELAAYWAGPRTGGAPLELARPEASLVAALLAADLTRWATGAPDPGPLPARRRLRCVDLRGLTVTEHPVLPVPDVAPVPATGEHPR